VNNELKWMWKEEVMVYLKYCPGSYIRKQKALPAICHGGTMGERRYSSYSYLTSALDGGEWSASHPGLALPLSVPIAIYEGCSTSKVP
jgi:hypothetical protein